LGDIIGRKYTLIFSLGLGNIAIILTPLFINKYILILILFVYGFLMWPALNISILMINE